MCRDEARLNRKNFDSALRRLARELDGHLHRAHLFISCRVSDSRGSGDRDAIIRQLPVPPPAPTPPPEPETALLAPIFDRKERRREPAETDANIDELLVVQLVPLDDEQRRALGRAAQIGDVDALMAAIGQHGLDTLAERPGDLLDLIECWRTHRRFGSLADMTEHAIARKLAESDKYRPDNAILTLEDARKGAERVAAALTLAKTFPVVSPAQELDPTLAAGALDADKILPDCNEDARNALLRRPCFATPPRAHPLPPSRHAGIPHRKSALLVDFDNIAAQLGHTEFVNSIPRWLAWLEEGRFDPSNGKRRFLVKRMSRNVYAEQYRKAWKQRKRPLGTAAVAACRAGPDRVKPTVLIHVLKDGKAHGGRDHLDGRAPASMADRGEAADHVGGACAGRHDRGHR